MPNVVDRLLKEEVSVGEESWHYKLYQWWKQQTGGNSWGYQENLCHYIRVIVLWVPLIWFFQVPLFKWVRPWMIVATALTLLAIFTAYQLWPEVTLAVLLSIGIFVGGLIVLVMLVFGFWYFFEELSEDKRGIILRITFPLWILPYLFCQGLVAIGDWIQYYEDEIGAAIKWFFTAHKWYVIWPWSVTGGGAIIASYFLFGSQPTLFALFLIGATILVAISVLLVSFLIAFIIVEGKSLIENRLVRQRRRYVTYTDTPERQHPNTMKVAVHYLAAKKRKICPYILLPEDVSQRS